MDAARLLGLSVEAIHDLVRKKAIKAKVSASGQMRFDLADLKRYESSLGQGQQTLKRMVEEANVIEVNGTVQKVLVRNSMCMADLDDESVHLMISSLPYYDTKMYSRQPISGDLVSS